MLNAIELSVIVLRHFALSVLMHTVAMLNVVVLSVVMLKVVFFQCRHAVIVLSVDYPVSQCKVSLC